MCRNADTLKRLQEAEKKLKEAQTKAYISMDISNQEREQGNKVSPSLKPSPAFHSGGAFP